MPLNLTTIKNFLPTDIFVKIKKFFWGDEGYIIYDWSFKFSAKVQPALLLVMLALSWGNQFFRDIDIQCERGSTLGNFRGGAGSEGPDKMMNDHCWNSETFLVEYGTQPNMSGYADYPGVVPYRRGTDTIITFTYYKQIFICLLICVVITYLPHRFWKGPAIKMIKRLLEIEQVGDTPVIKTMVSYFLETRGFNTGLLINYVLCQFSAVLTPAFQWIVINAFIGPMYFDYGIIVIEYYWGISRGKHIWPNPMDIAFPKFAKCEKKWSGPGGDTEYHSAICQMPLNNMNQWTFFICWWVTVVIILANLISFLKTIFLFSSYVRNWRYTSFVLKAAAENVEKARTYHVTDDEGKLVTRQKSKKSVIQANVSFSEWLVLDILSKNLERDEFREFIRELVLTRNKILQLVPVEVRRVRYIRVDPELPIRDMAVISKNAPPDETKKDPTIIVVDEKQTLIPLNKNATSLVHISCPVKYERVFRPKIKTKAKSETGANWANNIQIEPAATNSNNTRHIYFDDDHGNRDEYTNPPSGEERDVDRHMANESWEEEIAQQAQ